MTVDGWHPHARTSREYVIWDDLWTSGRVVAMVEAFDDDGPYYANAITPQGETKRLGAGISLPVARDWCEETAGSRPPRRPTTPASEEAGT